MRTILLKFTVILLFLAGSAAAFTHGFSAGTEEVGFSYKNPILSDGADPWAYYMSGYYYYTHTTGVNITVWKSPTLTGLDTAEKKIIWSPPSGQPYSSDIWAPEIYFIDDRWYVYFAAGSSIDGFGDQRMWVLRSETNNALGKYQLLGQITSPDNSWAIDGSVIHYGDKLYFIWSGGSDEAGGRQNIYIASMSNPWTISSERVLLSTPEYEWERKGGSPWINEGPSALYKDGRIYIIYSASGSWSDFYCLGLLTFTGGDMLDPGAWTKSGKPIFESGNGIYAPGHSCYVKSPDGTEDWILYHAAKAKGSGWDRSIRIQKFTWNPDGTPNFGLPLPDGPAYPQPSGERQQSHGAECLQNGKAYRIKSRVKTGSIDSYLELAPEDGGYRIIASPWRDAESQKWIVTQTGEYDFALKSFDGNLALTIAQSELTAAIYEGGDSQKWNLLFDPTGFYTLASVCDGSSVELHTAIGGDRRKVGLNLEGESRRSGWNFELLPELEQPETAHSSITAAAKASTGYWLLILAGAALFAVAVLFFVIRKFDGHKE